MSEPASFRTELRVFEPQLSSALGWTLAATLAVVLAVVDAQPPELMSLVCGAVGLLLLLRITAGQVAGRVFRYVVRDRWRTLLYLGAIGLSVTACIVSASAAERLPGCQETLRGMPTVRNYHFADLAAALVVGASIILEPLWFRRSLAVQFLWPSSSVSYWVRWTSRVIAPTLIVVAGLGIHRAAADELWGPHLTARHIAAEAPEGLSPKLAGPKLAAAPRDESTVRELVIVARCQPDDRLAKRLVEAMRAQRGNANGDVWRNQEWRVLKHEVDELRHKGPDG